MKRTWKLETTSMSLHILAMVFMTCDHLWGTGVLDQDWLTCIGRLTFPIFAFLLVEGYFHTGNLKQYLLRLLVVALVSEIPFNLALYQSPIYPFHQNVLWTFLIALGILHLNEKAKRSGKLWRRILVGVLSIGLGYLIGLFTFVDYNGPGILMVLTFYYFRGANWKCRLLQLLAMGYINMELISGLGYELSLFQGAVELFLPRQAFAVLALILIWLYKGKQGYKSKVLQGVYYWFYPVHLLLLWLITM